ncbi:hypothetical protein [Moraxella caviae]|nr:hypothetical protein [Moraxella caviae]
MNGFYQLLSAAKQAKPDLLLLTAIWQMTATKPLMIGCLPNL